MLADEPYKLELLEGIKDETVTFFTQGEFSDMCRGPHLSSTGKLKAFRLTSIAGAYWRGDSSKKMLTKRKNFSQGWRKPKSATTTSWEESSAFS